jgi:HD-GYP domain-containing protein (c-di-GMP phosphodiesterase class II)
VAQYSRTSTITTADRLGSILLAPGGVRLLDKGEPFTNEMSEALVSLGITEVFVAATEDEADRFTREARCVEIPLAALADDQAVALDVLDEKDRVIIPGGTPIPALQRQILERIGIRTVWVESGLNMEQEAQIGRALLRLQKLKREASAKRAAAPAPTPMKKPLADRSTMIRTRDEVPAAAQPAVTPPKQEQTPSERRRAVSTRVIPAPGKGSGRPGRSATGRPTTDRQPLAERLKSAKQTTASETLVDVPAQRVAEERLIDAREISAARIDSELDAGGEEAMHEEPSGPPLFDSILTPEPLTLRPAARIREMVEIHSSVVKNAEQIFAQVRMREHVDPGLISGLSNSVVRGLVNDQNLVLNLSGLITSNHYLVSHSINTTLLAVNIAAVLGFSTPQVFELAYGALLHDIGMARIKPEIVAKKSPLAPDEALEVRRHPVIGLDILQTFSRLPKTTPLVVYQENERLDGTGYPRRRKRALIHTYAKIVMVASAYDAMCSDRPHRPARLPYHGMERILQEVNAQKFETEVVRALLRVMGLFPVGSWVRMSDGSVARVVAPNQHSYTRPVVSIVVDPAGSELNPPHPIDLGDPRNQDLRVVEPLPAPTNLTQDLRTAGF